VNVFPLTIPPLKERPEDIPIIIQHFLEQYNQKSTKKITGLSPEAVARLSAHAWPGNVRELRNAVEYALVLCPGGEIDSRHLPQKIAAEAICPPPFASSPHQERDDLIRVLRQADGNQSAAARMLGVSRVTVWKRMKKHHIDLTRDVN
jgi:DNA-binding NtrC family response regulator